MSQEQMSMEKQVKDSAGKLRNVGPKLAAKLVEAGIDTPEKLRQTGATIAFAHNLQARKGIER
jgi:hypothetical protein